MGAENAAAGPVKPLTLEETEAAAERVQHEGYLHRQAVNLDIAVDETLGGPMGMTISTRLGIAAMKGRWWGKLGCRILNLFQNNHDARAAAGDLERARAVSQVIESSGIAQLSTSTPEEDEAFEEKAKNVRP